MTVRMLVSIAGHAEPEYGLDEGWSYQPGEIVELDANLVQVWIAAGHCEMLPGGSAGPQTSGKEYAVREPPERRKA